MMRHQQILYRRAGCVVHGKPVLVLQHGFLCGPDYFSAQEEYFSQHYDVIVPTLPGFADHGDGVAIGSIDGFVDYLLLILDDAGVDRFNLLGHSMGGMIAQQTALRAGDRIDGLVLYGTGPVGEMPGRFESIEQSIERVKQRGIENVVANTVVTWFVDGSLAPSYQSTVETGEKATMDGILGGYKAMQQWCSLERLNEIPNDTLVVWGDCDQSYRREQVEHLLAGITNAQLEVMPGCSHAAHLENQALFNLIVDRFLTKLRQR